MMKRKAVLTVVLVSFCSTLLACGGPIHLEADHSPNGKSTKSLKGDQKSTFTKLPNSGKKEVQEKKRRGNSLGYGRIFSTNQENPKGVDCGNDHVRGSESCNTVCLNVCKGRASIQPTETKNGDCCRCTCGPEIVDLTNPLQKL